MTENASGSGKELKIYIAKNMIMGVILAVFVIILVKIVIGWVSPSGDDHMATPERQDIVHPKPVDIVPATDHRDQHAVAVSGGHAPKSLHVSQAHDPAHPDTTAHQKEASHSSEDAKVTSMSTAVATSQKAGQPPAHDTDAAETTQADPTAAPDHEDTPMHAESDHGHAEEAQQTFPVVGMAFVDAVIRPLEYELTQRFYGWRPNDILNFTDNINNFQLGVLEVTRRSAVILAERISRTGSTAAFDPGLENAMNWFMIKPDRYWFPSAESKYKASLEELRNYFHKLEKGEAQVYTRTDNLIPLLTAYQDLLGSCDENLVKATEDDGTPVSFFKSDDYFFYAKGVATTMYTILKGIEIDFNVMVSREGGLEVLHHAIESCHHAMEVDPWIILNSDLSSVLANHRLNMAAPISHARFYLGVLIKALST